MLDHDGIIGAEAEAIAVAGERVGHDAGVPGTDWTLAELLDHVGRLCWFWSGRVRKAGGGDFYDTDRPDDVSRSDFLRSGATTMREQLAAADPAVEVKTWAGLKPPSWLWRRMTHELAVHRWDAQAAGGEAEPLAADVAADGIDELLEEFVPVADLSTVQGTLHLHATEGEGEWFIETADGLVWSHAHAKGDVAVRGTPSNLLLVLWGRIPVDRIEVLGDDAVFDRWRAATRF